MIAIQGFLLRPQNPEGSGESRPAHQRLTSSFSEKFQRSVVVHVLETCVLDVSEEMRKHCVFFGKGQSELRASHQLFNNMLKPCFLLLASLSVCLAAKDCFYCESGSSRDCKFEALNCTSLQYVTQGPHQSANDFKCVKVDIVDAEAKSHIRTCVGVSSKSELACSNVKNGLSDGQRLETCHECGSDWCNSSPRFGLSTVLSMILSLTASRL